MTLFAILAMGVADRVRGGGWFAGGHLSGMLAMGLITAGLVGAHGLVAAYVVAAVMLGAAPGWGEPLGALFDRRPMGPNYEWWQRGFLRESAHAAAAARGVMWGLPLLPVSPTAALAYVAAFTASPYLVRNYQSSRVDMWGVMEVTRGILIAGIIALTNKTLGA